MDKEIIKQEAQKMRDKLRTVPLTQDSYNQVRTLIDDIEDALLAEGENKEGGI